MSYTQQLTLSLVYTPFRMHYRFDEIVGTTHGPLTFEFALDFLAFHFVDTPPDTGRNGA